MQASQHCDHNVGLPHKASWHAYITLAHLTMPAGNCFLEAVTCHECICVSLSAFVSAYSHQNSVALMHVPCFSQSAAHTSRKLSPQGLLLCQAVFCQPDTESSLTAAVLWEGLKAV